MKAIDLRSDTVTLPSDEIRQAIFDAQLGDDVFQEDSTVNLLEEKAAKLSGVKNFLFISTSHIYKPINSYNVYTNTFFKKDPKGIYGKTKLEAEKNLYSYQK